jgi:Putative transmembrane protein (PGPGW)
MKWLEEFSKRTGLDRNPRIRKFVIALIGSTILLIGLALVVLPGPAVVVIPVGLAILASEFAWARRIIRRGKIFVGKVRRTTKRERAQL